MKNGFTLIELLAVIVILAIIALIAVPIVLNIINESKESSLLRSAEFYLDAAEYTIADAFLYHGGLEDKEYPIDINGDICKIGLDNEGNCPKTGNVSNTLKVEVNGEKPTGGTITIQNGNISDVSLILDEKTIVQNPDGELAYLKTLDEVCSPSKNQYFQNIPMEPGYKYDCKVDPDKDPYSFYVLNKSETEINLIMDRNLAPVGQTPIDEVVYKEITGKECNREDELFFCIPFGFTELGPIFQMRKLVEQTRNWTNLDLMTINTFELSGRDVPMAETYNAYARLPKASELTNYSVEKAYLYDNMFITCKDEEEMLVECDIPNGLVNSGSDGYVTQSFRFDGADEYEITLVIGPFGAEIGRTLTELTSLGVRPVINLKL